MKNSIVSIKIQSIEDMHDEVTSMRERIPDDGLVIDDYEEEFIEGFVAALEFFKGYYDNLGEIFSCHTPDLYNRSYSKPNIKIEDDQIIELTRYKRICTTHKEKNND